MKHSKLHWRFLVLALAAILMLGACGKKKTTAPPPPPPPPPPAPTASLSANPATIMRGQSTTLTWRTSNATDVRIDPIGPVQPSGSQQVSPTDSTNYRLIAKGAGGTQESTARVTVTQAEAQPAPTTQTRNLTLEDQFARSVKDVFFDYDKYDVRDDQQSAVQATAAFLKQHPEVKVTVEGHCDERGSTEYNLALGDNRARAAKDALVALGVSAAQLNPISFGKEKPFCSEQNEQCWQQNRRAHFVMAR